MDVESEGLQAIDEPGGLIVVGAAIEVVWPEVAIAGSAFQHVLSSGEHRGRDRAAGLVRLSVPGHALRCGPETSVTSPLRRL